MEESFHILVTDNAQHKIAEVLSKKNDDYFFQIVITPGGCSGFNTSFEINNQLNKDDVYISVNNKQAKVVINKLIGNFINDAVLHYKQGLLSSYFYLEVKTAKDQCSCGSSFSL